MSASLSPDRVAVALSVIAIAGAPTGIYLFYRGFTVLARKRLIQNIPRSTIRSAAIGQVELAGKATVSRLSWKWRKRSSVKIAERTYEERAQALHC